VYPDASTEEKPEVKDGHRLSLDVSIENNIEEEFEDVWYKITLNEETEPYIASMILEWTSDKMDVTIFKCLGIRAYMGDAFDDR